MTIAADPIALLKECSQLVGARDHRQMAPIVQAQSPVGAEHLVGSIQTYLTERFWPPAGACSGITGRMLTSSPTSSASVIAPA